MTLAIGLAMRGLDESQNSNLNLMPHETTKHVEQSAPLNPVEEKEMLKKYAVMSLVGTLVVIAMAFFFLNAKIADIRKDGLTPASLEDLQKQEADAQANTSTVDNIISRRTFFTTRMSELAKEVSPDIRLQSVSYQEGENEDGTPLAALKLEWEVQSNDPGKALLISNRFLTSIKQNKELMKGFTQTKMNTTPSGTGKSVFTAELS
jgi:hypothetical protein